MRLIDPANFRQADYIVQTSHYHVWLVAEGATHDPGLGGPIGGYLVRACDTLAEANVAADGRLVITENPNWVPLN